MNRNLTASGRTYERHMIDDEQRQAIARHNPKPEPRTKCDDCGNPIVGEPVKWERLTLCQECGG